MVSIDDIADAAERVASIVRPTPCVLARTLSELTGREVMLKPEYLQRTGSFKVRGAYNFISHLAEEDPGAFAVAASAGNHAQGVALAATEAGLRSTIFMPRGASLPKVEATRSYGAEVVIGGISIEECIASARAFAVREHATYVPPFDDARIIAGQGTVGLEMVVEAPDAEFVLVPVGGGGLIAGISIAVTHQSSASVIGVEAAGAASLAAALEVGHPIGLSEVHTMADGIAVGQVGKLPFEIARTHVAQVIAVDDEAISRAVLFLLERSKAVVEPSGAVGIAALLDGQVPGTGPVTVVLSGGNVDPLLLTRLIDHGLSASGRYLGLRIVLDDRPGALSELTRVLALLDLNVLTVDHYRSTGAVAVNEVEVVLTVETGDPDHRDEVAGHLREAGFRLQELR